MRTLNFVVDGQNIQKEKGADFAGIVRGSKGYLQCYFTLSREWSGCQVIASFWAYGKEVDAKILKNNRCEVPDSITDRQMFSVSLTGVRGDYKITSGKCLVRQEG